MNQLKLSRGLSRFTWLLVVVAILMISPLVSASEMSGSCPITITLEDTSVAHNSDIVVSMYIENNVDTLRSFQFWINSSLPPEIFSFITDSGLVFDTTGSILAGWEYIGKLSISGIGFDIRLIGIADLPGIPGVTPGAPPDTVKQLLGRLRGIHPASAFDTLNDHTVNLILNTDFTDYLELETADTNYSIWSEEEYLDTNGFVCLDWDIDSTQNPPDTLGCIKWQQTAIPPWDSVEIKWDTLRVVDTTQFCVNNARVKLYLCGDLNGNGTPLNILDLNMLVARLFRMGPPADPPMSGDITCDGGVNVLDLNVFVNYLFRFGPVPCSNPSCFE